ncbi:MAG: hypothetical protein HPY45_10205 [Anaerolineae bacterium]|nr:hypothetical protein [Anaerolineae bacterium]
MEQKSTLMPLFVLSFLFVSVIICIVFLYSSALLGAAFGYFWFKNVCGQCPQITMTPVVAFQPGSSMTPIANTATITASPLPTQTPEPSHTFTPVLTTFVPDTLTPSVTNVPTNTRDAMSVTQTWSAEMTQQVMNMMEWLNQLYQRGKIGNLNGQYYRLPNFADEAVEVGALRKVESGYTARDFVLRADLVWQVDGNQGDWAESGCGVVFRENEAGGYYLVYLSADGRARLKRFIGSSLALIGRSTIYNVNRDMAEAELTLVVKDETVTIFVNREQKFENYSEPASGMVSFTAVNGNPYGFGTRCWMNNIDLWVMQ